MRRLSFAELFRPSRQLLAAQRNPVHPARSYSMADRYGTNDLKRTGASRLHRAIPNARRAPAIRASPSGACRSRRRQTTILPKFQGVRVDISAGIQASLAGRYASALFDLAAEQGIVTAVEADCRRLQEALNESPELHQLTSNPKVSRNEAKRVLDGIGSLLGLTELTQNFRRCAGEQPPPGEAARHAARIPSNRRCATRRSVRACRQRPCIDGRAA